jgi:DNA-binding CsgD family transcriptional regulator
MRKTELSERISRIFREQHLKNVDFARTLGISANYVSLLRTGRKKMISQPLARLIETTYGYRAEWVLTGDEPVHTPDANSGLQESTVDKIRRMDGGELRAVAAYIRTLDDMREETAPSQTVPPAPPAVSDMTFSERLSTLSDAERRVYDLFAQGCGARQTAERLGLSVNTIKTHVKKIYKKLGVKSHGELVGAAGGIREKNVKEGKLS